MSDPYVSRLEKYLRTLEARLVEIDQRVARIVLSGKVTEVREQNDDWQVRTELGKDPATGEVVKSPWVPVQPVASGDLKIKAKPVVGERMMVLSPSGVLGTGSWAIRGPFDEDHPAPKGSEDLIIERGDTRIVLDDKTITIKAPQKVVAESGGSELELKPGHANVKGEKVHTVGRTHLAVQSKDEEGKKKLVVEGLLDQPRVKVTELDLEPDPGAAAMAAAIAAAGSGGGGGGEG
ncbi:phage baseplate assembly protein V [Rhodoplanes elegans]|uniref:phage baseplate assembly protein V n=1 Tax=Rhodoplanes elegans TaxID=29408 RepID=UPI001472D53F|nr:phage baseplate assembly protein V [Rhodoplanes elegans]